jgi:hypothetical protein
VQAQAVAPVPGPAAPAFKGEEVEALVAPIALYPDALLAQVLMASTYPLEVVQAARWAKANSNVKGQAAVKAVEGQSWDVSVKSLVAFPQVLEAMDQRLDWTQKLGDAFLAQKEDVFAAVQRLRVRAQQSGHLQSNEQQKVVVEQAASSTAPQQTIVRIEPASPEVVYVPAYDPTVVYGAWGYPSYPPYYWPPSPYYYPGYAFASGFAWGIGLAAAGAIYSDCDWHGNDVDIDIDRATNIDRKIDRSKWQNGKWKHNAEHRRGVAYRDNATRQKFGDPSQAGVDARRDYRGRDGGADRGGIADRGGPGDRAGNAGAQGGRGGAGQRDAAGLGGTGRDSAFQGVGGGAAAQRDFNRGRSTANFSGGSRFGGGGFGGFRGGGRGGRR